MLPFVAVGSPGQADVVMLYNIPARTWRRTNPGTGCVTMYDGTYGMARAA